VNRSQLLIVVAYVVAALVAIVAGVLAPYEHPLAVAAIADVAATLAIFAFSFAYGNSSFYDAYWSVAPLPMALYWAMHGSAAGGSTARTMLVLALVTAWGARLTFNWTRGWEGLHHEDWRYVDLRARSGGAYWLVSFFGLHLFPTVTVFLGCLSMYAAVALGDRPFGNLDVIAAVVTIGAIWLEARADKELHDFRAGAREPGRILDSGVWAWSRHPNYFGEMSFWWGMWLFGVAAAPSAWWWTITGPLVITLMFRFASLPLMEERMLARRPHYAAHAAKTSLVVPWPRRART
jgi:steroid 5-alpha reductase family enzyme